MILSPKTISEPEALQQSGSRITRPSWPPFWIPVAMLMLASLVIRIGRIDERVGRLFWYSRDGWDLDNNIWVQLPYFFGTIPASVAGFLAAGYWLFCTIQRRRDWKRSLSGFLVMLMLIGPGVLVNMVFKEHFGRPRPSEVIEFGGEKTFQALGDINLMTSGKSFPSGHASMGFFWLGLFVFLWNRNRKWAWFFCALGLVHGLGMGLARMMTGSHWLSDVLWSAGFVYFTAWALYRWLFAEERIVHCISTAAAASTLEVDEPMIEHKETEALNS